MLHGINNLRTCPVSALIRVTKCLVDARGTDNRLYWPCAPTGQNHHGRGSTPRAPLLDSCQTDGHERRDSQATRAATVFISHLRRDIPSGAVPAAVD
jgi:hypothetical protein